MSGWRFWYWEKGNLISPRTEEEWREDYAWNSSTVQAHCTDGCTPPPGPRCTCGIYYFHSLDDLAAAIHEVRKDCRARGGDLPPVVIGRIETTGAILADPSIPIASRAGGATISRLYTDGLVTSEQADILADRYQAQVTKLSPVAAGFLIRILQLTKEEEHTNDQ